MAEAWHQAQVRRNPRDTFREKLQALVDQDVACAASQQARLEAQEATRIATGRYDRTAPPDGHQVRVEVPTWKFDDIGVALTSPCRDCLAGASAAIDRVLKLKEPE